MSIAVHAPRGTRVLTVHCALLLRTSGGPSTASAAASLTTRGRSLLGQCQHLRRQPHGGSHGRHVLVGGQPARLQRQRAAGLEPGSAVRPAARQRAVRGPGRWGGLWAKGHSLLMQHVWAFQTRGGVSLSSVLCVGPAGGAGVGGCGEGRYNSCSSAKLRGLDRDGMCGHKEGGAPGAELVDAARVGHHTTGGNQSKQLGCLPGGVLCPHLAQTGAH